MPKTKVGGKTSQKVKTRTELESDKDRQTHLNNVEKVRKLLVARKADDLMEMLLSDAENYTPVKSLSGPVNGRK
jgi:hypothetical protein